MGSDLISRSALLEAFDNLQPPGFEKSISGMVALRMIKGAPAVDAEPVRHAFWEADVWSGAEKHVIKTVPLTEENRRKYAFRKPFDRYLTNEHCSACKQNPLANFNEEYEFSDYCPHCGAKMDAEENAHA